MKKICVLFLTSLLLTACAGQNQDIVPLCSDSDMSCDNYIYQESDAYHQSHQARVDDFSETEQVESVAQDISSVQKKESVCGGCQKPYYQERPSLPEYPKTMNNSVITHVVVTILSVGAIVLGLLLIL